MNKHENCNFFFNTIKHCNYKIRQKKSSIAFLALTSKLQKKNYWHQAVKFDESPCQLCRSKVYCSAVQRRFAFVHDYKSEASWFIYIWVWTEFVKLTLIANDIWWKHYLLCTWTVSVALWLMWCRDGIQCIHINYAEHSS